VTKLDTLKSTNKEKLSEEARLVRETNKFELELESLKQTKTALMK